MNHEALASKAADAVGVTPHSDMRLFVEQAVKWAFNEAALSAAEPVATVAEMGAGGMRVLMPHPPGSADHLPIGTKLYAAPPAPSVAVKDWSAEIKKLREYRRLAYNTGFLYLADWMEEMAAALSAQVQDVAGWQLVPVRPTEEMLDAYWGQTGESEAMRSRVQARAKMYYHVMLAAAPAKQEGGANE